MIDHLSEGRAPIRLIKHRNSFVKFIMNILSEAKHALWNMKLIKKQTVVLTAGGLMVPGFLISSST